MGAEPTVSAETPAAGDPAAPAGGHRAWTFTGVPSIRDPRWGQVAALTTFAILGQTWLNWAVTPLEIALSVITCVGLDLVFSVRKRGQLIVPLSGLISGLGLAMLLRSVHPVFFVAAGVLAIGSKYFITTNGHHRFNPSNFGLVVTLAFTQGGVAMVTPDQWGGTALILFAIIGAGALVVFRAQRLFIPAIYLATAVIVAPLFHGGHFDLTQSVGGDVLAFAFFMITDPKTAPTKRSHQLIWAPILAVLGALFVWFGSMQGIFVAAFVVTLVRPLATGAWKWFQARRDLPSGGAALAA